MKSFLKYTLATITGIFLVSILGFLFLIVLIASSTSEKPVEVKANTVLYMTLNDIIVERAVDNPFYYLPTGYQTIREAGLNDIVANIHKAAKDDNIPGIYLQLSGLIAGMASTEEIRNALIEFKKTGKFIYAFSDIYTQKSYYLASVADSIFLNPEGNFFLSGMGSQIMFYKGALDKLGIEAQVIRHGEYKSAVEPFMTDRMSPENREQIMQWVGSIWKHMLKGIGEERGLDPEELDRLADGLEIRSPESAVEHGLVDALLFKDELINFLKETTDTPDKKDLKVITLRRYSKVPEKRDYKGFARDKIAVIYAHGNVQLGNSGEGTIAAERISKAIRKARRDSSIKAIVIRVNSGGGGVLASDIILRETELAAQVKPLVASMGDVAASAAYYILAPADTILAHPNTITGSIGVWGIFPNLETFMNKKLGITVDMAKTNPMADIGSPFRPLTAEEKMILTEMVEDTYENFVKTVAEGRNMSTEDVDEIGRGRVWSGENALEIGLIDGYGGLRDAIEVAAGLAELEKYRIQNLPKLEDPIDQFIREFTENAGSRMIRRELGQYYKYFESIEEIESLYGIQARLPFKFELY